MTCRVAISGANGRMGTMLVDGVLDDPAFRLCGALVIEGSPDVGRDAGASAGRSTGISLTDNPATALAQAQVLIDFTRPEATLALLPLCVRQRIRVVIGTTGFDASGRSAIEDAARSIPIVFAPNMSVGVNVMFKLVELATRFIGDGYDAEIIEAHHKLKADAPSGTALRLGEIVARARGVEFPEVAVMSREGVTGARQSDAIGFAVVRGGDIVGDHTVMFAGTGERLEISHRSNSRRGYVQGSLAAARFLVTRESGLFDMQDVLGLR